VTNPQPEDAAFARASGRLWLLTPGVGSLALRAAAAAPGALSARRVDGATDRASVRRLFTRLEGAAGGGLVGDHALAVWLERNLERGRVTAFDVTPDQQFYPERLGSSARSKVRLPIPGGLVTAPAWPGSPIGSSSRDATRDRCAEVLHRACALMGREIRQAFEDRLVPESFKQATVALWRWAGDKDASATLGFDASVFSTAYQLAGWTAFEGLDYLARCAQRAVLALNGDDLDKAAHLLTQAVRALGVGTFFRIASLASSRGADSVTDQSALLSRWSAYIESLTVSQALAARGAVWGALSPPGQAIAVDLARRSNRITLANVLQGSDFCSRFLAEFHPRLPSAMTRRVWDIASLGFLRQLRGRVTLYVEESGLARSTPGAALAAASTSDDPRLPPDVLILERQLGPMVTEVELVDVNSPSTAVVLDRSQIASRGAS